ncbi:acyl dehydratase [Algirhabdus cladophorae]|uniref:acyl dehydratase n=1 Tax=Algirhabdus cladophorae TaxID=3377108 RepID=UPI003B84A605
MMTQTQDDMQTQEDVLDVARADALRVTLDLQEPILDGDPLPPFFHYAYFWQPILAADLGRDGHPKVGGFIPDMGLPRRMWAGGRLEFLTPLIAGRPAQKRSTVLKSERKTGRSGPLGFVTISHEIWQDGQCALREEQDLVYREEAKQSTPSAPKMADTDHSVETREFSTTQLFRYSALTFNGHKIHYDREYASEVEGYNGLVVHGPLLAQYLMLMGNQRLNGLSYFDFRGTSALLDHEPATFHWDGGRCWVSAPDGRLCMQAQAR